MRLVKESTGFWYHRLSVFNVTVSICWKGRGQRKERNLNNQYRPAQFHLVDKAGITAAAGPGNSQKPFAICSLLKDLKPWVVKLWPGGPNMARQCNCTWLVTQSEKSPRAGLTVLQRTRTANTTNPRMLCQHSGFLFTITAYDTYKEPFI